MADTNDKIRSTLLSGLLNPWVAVGTLVGGIAGFIVGKLFG